MQSSQDHISWREVQNKSFSHTHTPTQLDQKITVHATLILRSRDINSTGFHIETARILSRGEKEQLRNNRVASL